MSSPTDTLRAIDLDSARKTTLIQLCRALGLRHTGAWMTTYSLGNTAQIMTEGIARDLPAMKHILNSDTWSRLHEQLLDYVINYEQKIVRVSGHFQI